MIVFLQREGNKKMTTAKFTVSLPNYVEARPVAEIVQTASQYELFNTINEQQAVDAVIRYMSTVA